MPQFFSYNPPSSNTITTYSKEGFKVGDILYFSCDELFAGSNKQMVMHWLIKTANTLSLLKGLALDNYNKDININTVHVEVVIGIDCYTNSAILAGFRGGEKFSHKIGFDDFIKAGQIKEATTKCHQYNCYTILRPKDAEFAYLFATEMDKIVSKQLPYSYKSCLMTIAPNRFKQKLTSDSNAMMCQESTSNALILAEKSIKIKRLAHGQPFDAVHPKLKPQTTPGKVFSDLMRHHPDQWTHSKSYNLNNHSKNHKP